MGKAAIAALVSASALPIGAALALGFRLPSRAIGLGLALGLGALILSVTLDLVVPALGDAQGRDVALAVLLGAVVYWASGQLTLRRTVDAQGLDGVEQRPRASVVLVTVLSGASGIPASFGLGAAIALSEGVSVALIAAIWLVNLPDAVDSTVRLQGAGIRGAYIVLLWLGIVLASVVSSVIGFVLVDSTQRITGALIGAFAAGAVLSLIANRTAPAAYRMGGRATGLAVSFGFVLCLGLASLEV